MLLIFGALTFASTVGRRVGRRRAMHHLASGHQLLAILVALGLLAAPAAFRRDSVLTRKRPGLDRTSQRSRRTSRRRGSVTSQHCR